MNMVCKACGRSVHQIGKLWYHDVDFPKEANPERRQSVTRQLATIAREVEDLDAKVEQARTAGMH